VKLRGSAHTSGNFLPRQDVSAGLTGERSQPNGTQGGTMPDFCNINAAQFAVGQVATPETLSAIRTAAGVQKHRLERPEDLFNLLPKPDRIRVLVNDRNEIDELICG